MISEERIKQIWGEVTRTHQLTDETFRTAFARAIEKETKIDRFRSALIELWSKEDPHDWTDDFVKEVRELLD